MTKRWIIPVVMAVIIAACSGTVEEVSNDTEIIAQAATDVPVIELTAEPVIEEPTTVAADPTVAGVIATDVPVIEPTVMPTIEPTSMPETTAYSAPDWTSLQLVNARTGEAFTLADFAGKTVFVEPMATWCSNCRAQQGNVAQTMSRVSPDDFVFISLSVGENVSSDVLAGYADRNSFPQVFAVASTDITRALVDTFGFSVTSPPSTPHFIISPTGIVSSLSTGMKNSEALYQEVLTVHNS